MTRAELVAEAERRKRAHALCWQETQAAWWAWRRALDLVAQHDEEVSREASVC